METSLVQTTINIEQEVRKQRDRQRRIERRLRRRRRGTRKLEEIAEQEVTAVVKKYEVEKSKINQRMSVEYTVLNTVKEEQTVII